MRAVVQRVSEASVKIDGKIKGQIQKGLLILLGIENADTSDDIDWLSSKIARLRIFSDDQGLMNLSVQDISGGILVISQFTLHSSTKKGNRPSFLNAARPETAIPLYGKFIEAIQKEVQQIVQTGEFGAEMKVSLLNDGPVTIIMDSRNRDLF